MARELLGIPISADIINAKLLDVNTAEVSERECCATLVTKCQQKKTASLKRGNCKFN